VTAASDVHSVGFRAALDAGRTSAVAGQIQRDMRGRANAYADLFPAKPFDATMFSMLSQAIAFSSPWLDADRLRIAGRAAIWAFGLDWCIDYLARSPDDVAAVIARCLAVADGNAADPDDSLARFLAEIRDELAFAVPALHAAWREELARMLEAQAREWQWHSAGALPSLTEYLANAANAGFSFVFVSHLSSAGDPAPTTDLPELRTAARQAERVIRLLNDLASYDRDRAWGDLNALMLPGVARREVEAHLRDETDVALDLIDGLRGRYPESAGYLERQLGFCSGIYRIADFWAAP
jgi:hypothetical protein